MRYAITLAFCLLAAPALAQVSPDDPALTPDAFFAEEAEAALSAEGDVALVRLALSDAKVRKTATDLALVRMAPAKPLKSLLAEHLTALLDNPLIQQELAVVIAEVFGAMGMVPSNPDVIARVVGEQLPVWGDDQLAPGMGRLDLGQQRAHLGLQIRYAMAAGGQDCADYLSGLQSPGQTRAMQLRVMADWRADEVRTALALMRAAIVAELADTSAVVELTDVEYSQLRAAAGRAILAAVDAGDNPAGLYAAFGFGDGTPEQICTAHVTMLQAVQAMEGAEAGLVLRYVSQFGLNG